MNKNDIKKIFKRVWYFIWEDNSIWSWLINIVLAFILIKFLVYPGLGFALSTTHPIVAVVSSSMEHRTVASCVEQEDSNFLGIGLKHCTQYKYNMCGNEYEGKRSFKIDDYWEECGNWYKTNTDISSEDFSKFSLKNGFNKGDIMVLAGKKPGDIKIGDVIVFNNNRPDPIIHRVVKIKEENNVYFFQTKGDNNKDSIQKSVIDETKIDQEDVVGKAVVRVPFLGYIKIWFVGLLGLIL